MKKKLIAAYKGSSVAIPIAVLSIISSGLGPAIMKEGKDQVEAAMKASGAAAGVVLATDVVLTAAVIVLGHHVLDEKFYKNATPEQMLTNKTKISAVASALASLNAGPGISGLLYDLLGSVLTGREVSLNSVKKDILRQLLGTVTVHGTVSAILGIGGTAAWLYKMVRGGENER